MGGPIISFKNVTKEYKMGDVVIKALNQISFDIPVGSFTLILGASGAGKSTVLNILGGMDYATAGEVTVNGMRIDEMKSKKLTKYRRENVGFVFQFYNLIPNLTVLENVELARQICPKPIDAKECLESVGLGGRLKNFPTQISGGEQQRVAIARALAKNPAILLCDEPTGALDYVTGKSILSLLTKLCRDTGKTIVVVTHNSALIPIANQVIKMKNGTIVKEEFNETPARVEDIEW